MISAPDVGWVDAPLRRFVNDARVIYALLLHPTGQVLGQFGFTRRVDVMGACSLAAAIHAASAELGKELEGTPFRELHFAGPSREVFMSEVTLPGASYLFLTVFDATTSLGLVQLYFRQLAAAIAAARPAARASLPADQLEQDLTDHLTLVLGRPPVPRPPHPSS
ncbi:MAG: hypothetical protein M3068_07330 [Gemmatimonadota bacterium]|nr:hypothetical protein [Gemmatimonadota bacterium]